MRMSDPLPRSGRGSLIRLIHSNRIFLLSLSMQFFSEDDRVCQVAHGPPQPATLASQIQISLFFSDSVPKLQNSFCTLDDLSGLQSSFHFERFGYEPRIFEGQCRLAGDSAGETDLFGREWPPIARIDIEG